MQEEEVAFRGKEDGKAPVYLAQCLVLLPVLDLALPKALSRCEALAAYFSFVRRIRASCAEQRQKKRGGGGG